MRITRLAAQNAALADIRRMRQEHGEAARVASDGRRIQRPSDDPVGARDAALLREAQASVRGTSQRLSRAAAGFQRRESALAAITSRLDRARSLAVQGGTDTMSAGDRANMAAEIAEIRTAVIGEANAQFGGRYLFAGGLAGNAAFDPAGNYLGDNIPIEMGIPDSDPVDVTSDGGALLRGTGGGPDIITILGTLEAALLADNGPGIRAGLDDLDASVEHVIESRANLGTEAARVEGAKDRLDDTAFVLASDLSTVEEAGMAEAFSNVVRTRAAYERALQVTVQSRPPSIFDLL